MVMLGRKLLKISIAHYCYGGCSCDCNAPSCNSIEVHQQGIACCVLLLLMVYAVRAGTVGLLTELGLLTTLF